MSYIIYVFKIYFLNIYYIIFIYLLINNYINVLESRIIINIKQYNTLENIESTYNIMV